MAVGYFAKRPQKRPRQARWAMEDAAPLVLARKRGALAKQERLFGLLGLVRCSFAYSLLSASTGSFLLAALEGMRPARNVRNTLMATRMTAACHGSEATFATSNSE